MNLCWKRLRMNLLIPLGGMLILFSTCYLSVLIHDYGFMDDYAEIAPENHDRLVRKKILREGRPLFALLARFTIGTVTDLGDLRYVRLGSIVGVSILAFAMFRSLVRVGWKPFQSFCVAMIMCTSLPFQVFAAWAATSVFPIAGLLSGCALLIAEQTFSSPPPR